MATYIKDLVEDNGDITRPVTEAGAVLLSGGGDLETELTKYVTAEEIADISTIDVSALLARIYPVGSIYMSATISTASLVNATLGGTWVAWGAGRVPVGVDSSDSDFSAAGKVGGEKTHILTVSEMPSHTHQTINYAGGYTGGSQSGYRTVLSGTSTSTTYDAVKATGGGAAHNNLQPYITCYMYKRVA